MLPTTPNNRSEFLVLGKIAFQAGRFGDAATLTRELCSFDLELTADELMLLSMSHRAHFNACLRRWKAIIQTNYEDEVSSLPDCPLYHELHQRLQREEQNNMLSTCADLVLIIDTHALPAAVTHRSRIFLWKLKGDFLRYLWDVLNWALSRTRVKPTVVTAMGTYIAVSPHSSATTPIAVGAGESPVSMHIPCRSRAMRDGWHVCGDWLTMDKLDEIGLELFRAGGHQAVFDTHLIGEDGLFAQFKLCRVRIPDQFQDSATPDDIAATVSCQSPEEQSVCADGCNHSSTSLGSVLRGLFVTSSGPCGVHGSLLAPLGNVLSSSFLSVRSFEDSGVVPVCCGGSCGCICCGLFPVTDPCSAPRVPTPSSSPTCQRPNGHLGDLGTRRRQPGWCSEFGPSLLFAMVDSTLHNHFSISRVNDDAPCEVQFVIAMLALMCFAVADHEAATYSTISPADCLRLSNGLNMAALLADALGAVAVALELSSRLIEEAVTELDASPIVTLQSDATPRIEKDRTDKPSPVPSDARLEPLPLGEDVPDAVQSTDTGPVHVLTATTQKTEIIPQEIRDAYLLLGMVSDSMAEWAARFSQRPLAMCRCSS